MNEPQATTTHCEHAHETRILGGHPITVRACILCREPDWKDLAEQAHQLYQWGREEALAGQPARTHLSAYDMPRDDPADGPSIAECAEANRRWWESEKEGTQ